MTLSIRTNNNGYLAPRRVDLFSEISREMDQAMNNIFGHDFFDGLSKKGKGYPLLDAIRTKDSLILQYTVPGVHKDDLSVEISEDNGTKILSVSGKLGHDYIYENDEYNIKELSSQEFRRVIRLPEDVSDNDPAISLKDGILSLNFGLQKQHIVNNKIKKLKIS